MHYLSFSQSVLVFQKITLSFFPPTLTSPTAQLSKFLTLHLIEPDLRPQQRWKEQTYNYRLQLFKYCDMWSLAATKSTCNEQLGHKDWENRELISVACPHLSTQTHRIVFIVHPATVVFALWEMFVHCLLLRFHPQSCKTNMAIRKSEEKLNLHKPCAEKTWHRAEALKLKSYQRKTVWLNSLSPERTKQLLFSVWPALLLLPKAFRAIYPTLCFVLFAPSSTHTGIKQTKLFSL